jgi:hypothetical protein
MSVIVFLNLSLNRNICLLFCMIYLHCKFYNVIKINYGGPDTGHVRPATAGQIGSVVLAGRCWSAGRCLETPALDVAAISHSAESLLSLSSRVSSLRCCFLLLAFDCTWPIDLCFLGGMLRKRSSISALTGDTEI